MAKFPTLVLLISFAGLIFLGTILLSLPIAVYGDRLPLIDALFTATSATCVTGLIVVDTGSKFSLFGQVVILFLIQTGGLGIITFSTFFALMAGRKLSLTQRDIIFTSVMRTSRMNVYLVVRKIIIYAFALELIGAFILTLSWKDSFGWQKGFYHSLFHSISAFCNAGFSTFQDSLVAYKGDVLINMVIMLLVILGGIGFLVLIDIENWIRYRKKISLHSRLVILTTVTLIISGAILFCFFESSNGLAGMTLKEKVLISLFQSITPRTAGFNTISINALTNSSLLLIMILMFIGGSPGSAAGGIKTSTAALFFMIAKSRLRGRTQTEIHYRTVPEKVVNEAISVFVLAVILIILASLILQATELGYLPHQKTSGEFLELNFEAVSAFGTVGLSTGATAKLTWPGKVAIILIMFIGRLGPLSIAFIVGKRKDVKSFRYAEEPVIIG